MKRAFATILAILYLFTASGAIVHLHYCMGRLSSWSLVSDAKTECGTCGMAKKKGCCDEKTKVIKLAGDHRSAIVSGFQIARFSAAVSPIAYNITLVPQVCYNNLAYSVNDPPGLRQRALYLLHCVYRI